MSQVDLGLNRALQIIFMDIAKIMTGFAGSQILVHMIKCMGTQQEICREEKRMQKRKRERVAGITSSAYTNNFSPNWNFFS